jgi:hypothetical protein
MDIVTFDYYYDADCTKYWYTKKQSYSKLFGTEKDKYQWNDGDDDEEEGYYQYATCV